MLDRRLYAARPDLADIRLQGQVEAARFVQGDAASIIAGVAPLRARPDVACGIDTQLLKGETVRVLEQKGGWAWIVSDLDGYVGYLESAMLAPLVNAPTHWVTVPRSFLYAEPDLKKPVVMPVSMGSRLTIVGTATTRGTDYLLCEDGTAIIAGHAGPVGQAIASDPLKVAETFLLTPYLWGGRSGFGIDCSGLAQMSLMMCGTSAPRDSDQQEQSLGTPIGMDARQRGDLVFWKGHVGLIEDRDHIIHANGYRMQVTRERFDDAIERIRPVYGAPTGFRRP